MNASTNLDPNWDARHYDERHAYVWHHGAALLDLLAAKPSESILDLGCGTGHLTAQIAATGATVLGIDRSTEMISQARSSYPAIRFELADACALNFPTTFDAVFSNAVLHWIRQPERVIAGVAAALRPGGRFVAEFGGSGNVRSVEATSLELLAALGQNKAESPWYFPTIGAYARLLERYGFEVAFATLFDRPTPVEGEHGLRDWMRMFGSPFVQALPEDKRATFLERLEDRLRPRLYQSGSWVIDYRRLRIVARKLTT